MGRYWARTSDLLLVRSRPGATRAGTSHRAERQAQHSCDASNTDQGALGVPEVTDDETIR